MTISIEQQIVEAGEQNSQLLEALSSTEGAKSALAEHKRLLGDLRVKLQQSNQRKENLEAELQKRLGEHEKYHDSYMWPLIYKTLGMGEEFAQRVGDGKRECLKALQDVQKEQDINDDVTAKMGEARRAEPDLQAAAHKHKHAQRELDTLYSRIFNGSTPQLFPEEYERRKKCADAWCVYENTRDLFDAETQAVEQLNLAKGKLTAAMKEIVIAQSHRSSYKDCGNIKDCRKGRSYLLKADELVEVARGYASPLELDLPDELKNRGNIMFDIYPVKNGIEESDHEEIKHQFDPTTQYYHNMQIERGRGKLNQCVEALQALIDAADQRQRNLRELRGIRVREFLTAWNDLQRAREEVFRSVLRGGESGGSGAEDIGGLGAAEALRRRDSIPPAYEAAVEREAAPAYDT